MSTTSDPSGPISAEGKEHRLPDTQAMAQTNLVQPVRRTRSDHGAARPNLVPYWYGCLPRSREQVMTVILHIYMYGELGSVCLPMSCVRPRKKQNPPPPPLSYSLNFRCALSAPGQTLAPSLI